MSTSPRLVLASKSPSRRQILKDAGVPFEWMDTNIDEASIKHDGIHSGITPNDIALSLARAKAARALDDHPDAVVLGCDQLLVCDDQIFDKPESLDQARGHLGAFRGKSHTLISVVTLVGTDVLPWDIIDHATLTMRDVSDAFIESYIETEGDTILSSVGAYRLEGSGIQLFDEIVGNYFTILGLPLLPVLAELRQRGILES